MSEDLTFITLRSKIDIADIHMWDTPFDGKLNWLKKVIILKL